MRNIFSGLREGSIAQEILVNYKEIVIVKHTSHVSTSDIASVTVSVVPFFWSFIDGMAGSGSFPKFII